MSRKNRKLLMSNSITFVICLIVSISMMLFGGCKKADENIKDDTDIVEENIKDDTDILEEETKDESDIPTEDSEDETDLVDENKKEEEETDEIFDVNGTWTIDTDKTNANNASSLQFEFGSGIGYGYEMVLNEDGTASWYLGIGNGGEGTYTMHDFAGKLTYIDYEEKTEENVILSILQESGKDYILMEYRDYILYWIKAEEVSEELGYDVLESYAQQYSYLYAQTYNGYLHKTDGSYEYDLSEIPMGEIAYHIEDFDRDGVKELLIISFGREYSLDLRMYEQTSQGVVLADEIDLKDENIFIMDSIGAKEGVPAIMDCFIYGTDEIRIGIETSELASLLADGREFHFLSIIYNGNEMLVEANAFSGGSSGEYDSRYMSELEKIGISASYDEIFEQDKYVFNYVENYRDIMRITISYLLVSKDIWEREESDVFSLHCSQIYVSDATELLQNTNGI